MIPTAVDPPIGPKYLSEALGIEITLIYLGKEVLIPLLALPMAWVESALKFLFLEVTLSNNFYIWLWWILGYVHYGLLEVEANFFMKTVLVVPFSSLWSPLRNFYKLGFMPLSGVYDKSPTQVTNFTLVSTWRF